jgi:hypothetical protein
MNSELWLVTELPDAASRISIAPFRGRVSGLGIEPARLRSATILGLPVYLADEP